MKKRKIGFELVFVDEMEINGEKCYNGYVGVNKQRFRFWNLPINSVTEHFLDVANFCLERGLKGVK